MFELQFAKTTPNGFRNKTALTVNDKLSVKKGVTVMDIFENNAIDIKYENEDELQEVLDKFKFASREIFDDLIKDIINSEKRNVLYDGGITIYTSRWGVDTMAHMLVVPKNATNDFLFAFGMEHMKFLCGTMLQTGVICLAQLMFGMEFMRTIMSRDPETFEDDEIKKDVELFQNEGMQKIERVFTGITTSKEEIQNLYVMTYTFNKMGADPKHTSKFVTETLYAIREHQKELADKEW